MTSKPPSCTHTWSPSPLGTGFRQNLKLAGCCILDKQALLLFWPSSGSHSRRYGHRACTPQDSLITRHKPCMYTGLLALALCEPACLQLPSAPSPAVTASKPGPGLVPAVIIPVCLTRVHAFGHFSSDNRLPKPVCGLMPAAVT